MGTRSQSINEREACSVQQGIQGRLLELGQKPATQLALELGIQRNQLYKWQAELVSSLWRRFSRGESRAASTVSQDAKPGSKRSANAVLGSPLCTTTP